MAPNDAPDPLPADRPDRLRECSPSEKYVYTVLAYEGTLTQEELVARTMLPIRTVRHALATLEAESLVRKEVSPADARRRRYSIATE